MCLGEVFFMSTAGYVVLTFKFKKIDRRWTAYCEELGTATFGRSLPEADKRLKEAVLLHLNTLEEVGERSRFLKEHGIKLYQSRPKEDITVCLPVNTDVFIEPHVQSIPALIAA
jgi:predicted RNase H-like HicB family nuclease